MVARFNELRKLEYEQFTKALFLLEKIYNLKEEPQSTKAYKEERYNTRGQDIHGDTKHSVWPAPVLSNR